MGKFCAMLFEEDEQKHNTPLPCYVKPTGQRYFQPPVVHLAPGRRRATLSRIGQLRNTTVQPRAWALQTDNLEVKCFRWSQEGFLRMLSRNDE